MTHSGSRSNQDPYGYIDGGEAGAAYQLITSQQHKGEVLTAELMPILKDAWPAADLAMAPPYADRWVNHGTWTQPDPCAPYDGNPDHYGLTFGPDPANPGMCILDQDLAYYNGPTDFACQTGQSCGRYPGKHGSSRDGGQYRSDFVAAMWDAYRYAGALALHGSAADRAIHLNWDVNATLPLTTTWTLAYAGPPGDEPSPITGLPAPTRAYTLTGLTNYQWYTVTLNAIVDTTSWLTDTVRMMPTDRLIYLPLVLKGN